MAWRTFIGTLIAGFAQVVWGQPGNFFSGGLNANAAYVSSRIGNDGNGVVGNPAFPFEHIKTAFNAAQRLNPSNAVVILTPGETNRMDAILTGVPLTVSNNNTLTLIGYGAWIVKD